MAKEDAGPVLASPALAVPQDVGHRHLAADSPGLPAGFPELLESGLAWTGGQYSQESEYVYRLSGSDIEELHEALHHFKGGFIWHHPIGCAAQCLTGSTV